MANSLSAAGVFLEEVKNSVFFSDDEKLDLEYLIDPYIHRKKADDIQINNIFKKYIEKDEDKVFQAYAKFMNLIPSIEKKLGYLIQLDKIYKNEDSLIGSEDAEEAGLGFFDSRTKSLKYVISTGLKETRFRKKLSEDEITEIGVTVRKYISITPHPTSQISYESLKYIYDIEKELKISNDFDSQPVRSVLKSFLDPRVKLVNGKKNVQEEGDIALLHFSNYYNSITNIRDRVERAFRFFNIEFKYNARFFHLNDWSVADADGNTNKTAEELEKYIIKRRNYVVPKYITELEWLHKTIDNPHSNASKLVVIIISKLQNLLNSDIDRESAYPASADFRNDLRDLNDIISKPPELKKKIEDLLFRATAFGFYGMKDEIRHEGDHYLKTLCHMCSIGVDSDRKLIDAYLEKLISAGHDEISQIRSKIKIPSEGIESEIWKKFNIVARHPESNFGFIMSEFQDATEFKAVLALSKLAGLQTGKHHVIPLSEAMSELIKKPRMINELFKSESFNKYISAIKEFFPMYALSDNERRSGFGAIFKVFKSVKTAINTFFKKTQDFAIVLFFGAGASNSRGGFITPFDTESYVGYLKSVLGIEGGGNIITHRTIQGRAAIDHFSPLVIEENIYSSFAKVLNANIISRSIRRLDSLKEDIAKNTRTVLGFSSDLVENFNEYIRKDKGTAAQKELYKIINMLLGKENIGLRLFTDLANVSSREKKKGKVKAGNSGEKTFRSEVGEMPDPLELRAIGLDLVGRTSFIASLIILGVGEVFEKRKAGQLDENGKEDNYHDLKQAFRKDIIFQNSIMGLAQLVSLADPKRAWKHMFGEELPSKDRLEEYLRRLDDLDRIDDPEAKKKIAGAYLVRNIQKIVAAVYEISTGEDASKKRNFKMADILTYWPGHKESIERVHHDTGIAKSLASAAINYINADPDQSLGDNTINIIRTLDAALFGSNFAAQQMFVANPKAGYNGH